MAKQTLQVKESADSYEELYIKNIMEALRPDGTKAIRVDFVFDTPIMPIKNVEKSITVDFNPSQTITLPQENKVIIYFSVPEWNIVKDKFQVGGTYPIAIKDKKIVIG